MAADTSISAHSQQETKPAPCVAAESLRVQTPEPEQTHRANGQRFLCAVDGSEGSTAAFKFLLEKMVVPERGDSVVLFEACKPLSPDLIFIDELQRKMVQKEEERRTRERLRKLGGLAGLTKNSCEVVVITGDPREVIPKFVAKHPVDIVVVGTRGLGTMQRLLLGSVSSHLSHHLTVPVLVVHSPR